MTVIARSAYFSVCEECGEHGHVVCVNGRQSEEFATKSAGLRELTELVLAGEVAEDESDIVKEQINGSELEASSRFLDKFFREQFGGRRRRQLEQALDAFHDELDSRSERGRRDLLKSTRRTLN